MEPKEAGNTANSPPGHGKRVVIDASAGSPA